MAIIARIDIDSPFGWQNLFRKTLSRIHLDYHSFSFRYTKLGYLSHVKLVADALIDRDIPVFWFFQYPTRPSKKYARMLLDNGHEIGIHVVQDKTYSLFDKERNRFQKKVGVQVKGFTKHGSGDLKLSRNHDQVYDPDKLLKFAKKSNLSYFWGNGEDPSLEREMRDGVEYFPGAYWLCESYRDTEKHTFDWMLQESSKRDIVVLFHPINILLDANIREQFQKILEIPKSRFKKP